MLPWKPEFQSYLVQNLMQSIPHPNDASDKIWLRLAHWLRRYSSLKMFTHGPTDARTPDRPVYYKLTLWAFGSGELINVVIRHREGTKADLHFCCFHRNITDLGPVVQSIVSLTSSLRRELVKYMLTTLSNPLLFFVEKMWESFAMQKILTFSQQKNNSGFVIFIF